MGAIQSSLSSISFDFNKTPRVYDDQDWELLDHKVYYLPEGEEAPKMYGVEVPKMNNEPASPKPSPITFSEGKNARILDRAEIMRHAEECKNKSCLRPHCNVIKPAMLHNETCTVGNACTVPHCITTTQIRRHWRSCTQWDCPICWVAEKGAPLKKEMTEGLDVASWTEYSIDD